MSHTDIHSSGLESQLLLSREDRRQQFIELGWWVSIPLTTVPARWLYQGEHRLDGSHYAHKVGIAWRVVDRCGFAVKSLEEVVSEIFILSRFRRVYAANKEFGWPYLSASDALEFRPTSDRWIAKDHAPKQAERHFAERGWILISASGTVGRTVLVTPRLEKYFLTHDLIRVVPAQSLSTGYLYAYLSTWMGQTLISRDQYGSAINHLEPHHLAAVPVPILPDHEQKLIHDEIMHAYTLRDEANNLLDEADVLLHQELGLPRFDERLVPYLPPPLHPPSHRPEMPHPRAFTVRASELDERLDGSYHVPVVRKAVELLHHTGKYQPVRLGKMVDSIYLPPRFKRIYVQEAYGVPFLQGSHLPQMRPYDLKYISKKANAKQVKQSLIVPGYVLITRSGTIGRIGLIPSTQKGWAASEHLLRVIPDYDKGHPGYIAAFLMTPYGQHQLMAKIYGGVVDEITEVGTAAMWIPNAPLDLQTKIGEQVVVAFEKKSEASAVEEAAIRKLETALQRKE